MAAREVDRPVNLSRKIRAARKYSFEVVRTTRRLQVAFMSLGPGETSGEPDAHARSDQWLYVIAGRGAAVIDRRRHRLTEGGMVIIPAGAVHQIRNTGTTPLKTLNVYAPPEYPSNFKE